MKTTKLLLTSLFLLSFGGACGTAMALNKIDADDFVEDASAAGVAEIETGKLALQKSTAVDIKAYAQEIINDHRAANKTLADIAQQKKLKLSTDAELMSKAKTLMLKQHDGQSFNEAFAENQIAAHEKAIELFNKAVVSDDAQIAAFAKETLPKLEHHLRTAQELAKTYMKK
jgi:putative membrane protein